MMCQLVARLFLSTLSLRRATVNEDRYGYQYWRISIHALLAESDRDEKVKYTSTGLFLSTLSLRRATSIIDIINNVIDNFYPRSPCGERRLSYFYIIKITGISIHALLAESDGPQGCYTF